MDTPTSLRGELAASIERTLVNEARRNEVVIARVRLAGMILMIGMELWLAISGTALGSAHIPLTALTVAVGVWAAGLLLALESGRWAGWVPWAVTSVDAAYFGVRLGGVMAMLGAEAFVATHNLANAMGLSAALMVTGAFRLRGPLVMYASGLGVATYLTFALACGLHPFHITMHGVLLAVVGLASVGLTHIVDRAVRSEVTRMTVSRLLPATVLDAADADPLALLSEPRSLDATIVITDLRGFTRWAEHRDPLEVLGFLNTVQGALAEVVHAHGGTVDKFMGDGMLAVFGAPTALPDHADRAVTAARALQAVTERTGEVKLGVGIHSGEVVVGCLGSGVRMEFTVLGDTVNTASRLESATKDVGVRVLVSDATRSRLTRQTLVPAGRIPIRGREGEVDVYTLPDPE